MKKKFIILSALTTLMCGIFSTSLLGSNNQNINVASSITYPEKPSDNNGIEASFSKSNTSDISSPTSQAIRSFSSSSRFNSSKTKHTTYEYGYTMEISKCTDYVIGCIQVKFSLDVEALSKKEYGCNLTFDFTVSGSNTYIAEIIDCGNNFTYDYTFNASKNETNSDAKTIFRHISKDGCVESLDFKIDFTNFASSTQTINRCYEIIMCKPKTSISSSQFNLDTIFDFTPKEPLADYICKIGERQFLTLGDAINNLNQNDEIVLLDNVNLVSSLPSTNKAFSINTSNEGNNYSISYSGSSTMLYSTSDLELKGSGVVSSSNGSLFEINGNLIIGEKIKIDSTTTSNYNYVITLGNSGSLENNGTISSNSSFCVRGNSFDTSKVTNSGIIYCKSTTSVSNVNLINYGTIISDEGYATTTCRVNNYLNGTITGKIAIMNGVELNLNGGVIVGTNLEKCAIVCSNLNIKGGVIDGSIKPSENIPISLVLTGSPTIVGKIYITAASKIVAHEDIGNTSFDLEFSCNVYNLELLDPTNLTKGHVLVEKMMSSSLSSLFAFSSIPDNLMLVTIKIGDFYFLRTTNKTFEVQYSISFGSGSHVSSQNLSVFTSTIVSNFGFILPEKENITIMIDDVEINDSDFVYSFSDSNRKTGTISVDLTSRNASKILISFACIKASFNICFDANGGSGEMTPMNVNVGDKYTLPDCTFTYKYHTFDYWYLSETVSAKAGDEITSNYENNITWKAIWKQTDSDLLDIFVDTYLHMSDYNEEKGYCSDVEHHYYNDAKEKYNDLTLDQKLLFNFDDAYASAKARLLAWATANGEYVDSETQLLLSRQAIFSTKIATKCSPIIIVCLISSCSLLTFLTVSKFRKNK